VKDGYVHNRGFSVPKGQVNGIFRIRIEIFRFISSGQQMVAQKAADYILAQISGNLFRAFVPEADSPVSVNNVDSGFEAIEDGLIDFRIV
jgi:hypothetical protein